MIIYLIENLVNGKRYIGKTKNLSARWKQHKLEAQYRGKCPLYAAIRKYGEANFKISILEVCPSTEEANKAERELIKKHRTHVSFGNGYNVLWGGDGTEAGEKSPSYRIVRTAEYLERNSASQKRAWRKEGARERRSKIQKEVHARPELRRLASESNRIRWRNPEYRERTGRAISRAQSNPTIKLKHKQGCVLAWNRPGAREKRSEAMRLGWARKLHGEKS